MKRAEKIYWICVCIALCILTGFGCYALKKQGDWLEEHPCIETKTIQECNNVTSCKYISVIGPCIPETKQVCHRRTVCLERE